MCKNIWLLCSFVENWFYKSAVRNMLSLTHLRSLLVFVIYNNIYILVIHFITKYKRIRKPDGRRSWPAYQAGPLVVDRERDRIWGFTLLIIKIFRRILTSRFWKSFYSHSIRTKIFIWESLSMVRKMFIFIQQYRISLLSNKQTNLIYL